jgi:DNA-binding IclR family transcriptional regulator
LIVANSTKATRGVDSARRVLQILLQFSETKPETTIEEIAKTHGISVPSAYRYLSLLREMYLVEERNRGSYSLSPQVLRLAAASEVSLDLASVSRPILESIMHETHETALVVKRIRDAAVCVAVAQPDKSLAISFRPGHIMPLHRGAAAKTLLANLPQRKQQQYFAALEPKLPAEELYRLETQLELIGQTNFSESESEVDSGVWAVAAPVVVSSRVLGAVSIVAPAFRIPEDTRARFRVIVKEAAVEIANVILNESLGHIID